LNRGCLADKSNHSSATNAWWVLFLLLLFCCPLLHIPFAHLELVSRTMPFAGDYRDDEPTRDEIDRSEGQLLLEFGANWCGHCLASTPAIESLLKDRPNVSHLRIADGRGKPLGRSFRVKLWPTFVFLDDGAEIAKLVRPTEEELRGTFDQFAST
jgi:thioredoxin 1